MYHNYISRSSDWSHTRKVIEEVKRDFLKINFGDIDGRTDPNLNNYFFDRNYWEKIIKDNVYFVIGRKGTGKSALYTWLRNESYKTNCICHNILFNSLPLRQLLNLSDDTYLKPNQYQTICENMLLSELCKIILEDGEFELNENSEILQKYDRILGSNIENCFKRTVSVISKSTDKLLLPKIFAECSAETQQSDLFDFTNPDIQSINTVLRNAIINYLKCYSKEKKFIIQIDGVDEHYTQIISMSNQLDDYLSLIISLMKTVYSLNQELHMECQDIAKCIVYLRSDILERIHGIDAESARWSQQTEYLNWTITRECNWYNNDLRNLIKTRINASLNINNQEDCFEHFFNSKVLFVKKGKYKHVTNFFEYMTIRSFHRPRDIIQFCICFQNEVKKSGYFSYKEFLDGEKKYSLWFLQEIKNEISPDIKDTESLFTMLRTLGGKPFAISLFKSSYSKYQEKIGIECSELLRYLYELGVIYNVADNGNIFNSMRNYQSRLNPDMKIALHAGFWKGLYTSTY